MAMSKLSDDELKRALIKNPTNRVDVDNVCISGNKRFKVAYFDAELRNIVEKYKSLDKINVSF